MAVEGVLTEEDKALLDHIDDRIDEADDATEFEEVARGLQAEFRKFRAEFRKYQNNVENRLHKLESRETVSEDEDQPPIVHYANIPEEDRADHLGTSDLIAVTLFENWEEIAWTLGGGRNYAGNKQDQKFGVDTKSKANAKYNPSRIKHRLKQFLDQDLQSNEVYRGLKRLASLSGGEEHVDTDGRVHITGGWFAYQERATADNNDVRRVLWRDDDR